MTLASRIPLRVLMVTPFRLLWIGQALSNIGNYMLPVALPLLALGRGDGASGVALLLGLRQFGAVVSLPLGGVVGDRLPRRTIMLSADAIRLVCVIGLAAASLHGSLLALGVFAFVAGIGEGIYYPAQSALIPEIVPESSLQQANSLLATTGQAAMLVAPALAALLTTTLSVRAIFLVDAATFVVSLTATGLIKVRKATGAQSTDAERQRLWSSLVSGWRYLHRSAWIGKVIYMDAVLIFAVYSPIKVLLPILMVQRFDIAAWSALLIAQGVGAILGGTAASFAPRRNRGLFSLLALLPVVPFCVLLAYDSPVWLLGLCYGLAGFGQSVFGVVWSTATQEVVPRDMLSRVVAIDWFISMAFAPIGVWLTAPLHDHVSSATILLASAVIATAVILSCALRPRIRRFEPERANHDESLSSAGRSEAE